MMSNEKSACSWKRTLIILALFTGVFSLSPAPVRAQDSAWRRVAHMQNWLISDIECRPNGVCVMVGQLIGEAVVWLSTDAGHTWRDVYRRDGRWDTPAVSFHQVQFLDDSTLIVGATKGFVARSTDLGRTFDFVQVTDTAQTEFLQVNERGRGSVIFSAHPLYRLFTTDDAGRSWRRIPLPDTVRFGDSLRPIPSSRVAVTSSWRVGGNGLIVLCASHPDATILSTTDDGATWSQEQRSQEATRWFEFVDSAYGFLYGGAAVYLDPGDEKPAIFRTTNAGSTWSLSLVGARIRDIATHDGRRILAVGELNKVYTSNDSGLTWQKDSFPNKGPVTSWCELPDSGAGVIVGAFGDLFLKDVVSSVEATDAPRAGTDVRQVEGTVLIDHGPDAREVLVRLYDVSGRHLGVVPARRQSATRSVGILETWARTGQALIAVVEVDGRHTMPGSVLFVR